MLEHVWEAAYACIRRVEQMANAVSRCQNWVAAKSLPDDALKQGRTTPLVHLR